MTSQHVPGFHGEDPDLATPPWWPGSQEQPSPGPGDRAAARRDRAWRAAAAALAAAFVVLLPAAMTSAWIRGTVLSTSGYVAAVSPVAANPVVRAAVQEAVTSQVDAVLNHAESALPPAARGLAGPLSRGLADLAGHGVSEFMASQAFQRLWVTVNRFTHSQLISVLNGDSTLVTTTSGQVVLNLVPLVNGVLHDISGRLSDLSGGAITLHPISGIPAAACHALARVSHRPVSATCGQIPLFPATALSGPRRAYRALTTATWLVLILTPLAFASALAAAPAPRRRRTLLQMTIGGTLTLLVTLTALSRLQSTLITRGDPRYQAMTGVIVQALTNSFFTLTTWFLAVGLALGAITLLSGPYRWAAAIRTALRTAR